MYILIGRMFNVQPQICGHIARALMIFLWQIVTTIVLDTY